MLGRGRGRPPYQGITPAEARVLALIREGKANAEIAALLDVSVNTVRYHVANLFSKAGVNDRAGLLAWRSEPPPNRSQPHGLFFKLALGASSISAAGAVSAVALMAAWPGNDSQSPSSLDAHGCPTAATFEEASSSHGHGLRAGPVHLTMVSLRPDFTWPLPWAPAKEAYAQKMALLVDEPIGTPLAIRGQAEPAGPPPSFELEGNQGIAPVGSVHSFDPRGVTPAAGRTGSVGEVRFPATGCYQLFVTVGTTEYGPFGVTVERAP